MSKPGLALIVVLGILAVLGLAVLGWGGLWPFLAHPARVVTTLVCLLLTAVALFSEGNLDSGVREDRADRWVLVAFTVLGILLSSLPALTDRLDVWTIDGDTVRWLGVALFTAGGALWLWPVFVLGRRFSGLVAIQYGHSLATTGVYRRIRHPSYLGLLVAAVGWALVFRSTVGLLSGALLVPLVARIATRNGCSRRSSARRTKTTSAKLGG